MISPVFDTQIAAGCIGLKPQIGYADLVKTLLDVTLPKGQTRTDWSKRPLSARAAPVRGRRCAVSRRDRRSASPSGCARWAANTGCSRIAWRSRIRELYEPDPERAWQRLRSLKQLPPAARAARQGARRLARAVARERDLPRGWIVSDAAIFKARRGESRDARGAQRRALASPTDERRPRRRPARGAAPRPRGKRPRIASRPGPAADARAKALIDRLAGVVDARAADLGVSAEILAPRGELKALAMGERDAPALAGWRREEIGERLLEALVSARPSAKRTEGPGFAAHGADRAAGCP